VKNCSCTDCECIVDGNGNCCCNSIPVIEKPLPFWYHVKKMYPSAIGIIVLCVVSSQIGQGISFVLFGYHDIFGIAMSYAIGYGLASLTTFCTIIGRYNLNQGIGGCCSALEKGSNLSFARNIKNTFHDCWTGIKTMPRVLRLPNAKNIVLTSIYILITAESACILTAETINLAFLRHAMWLSMPLGLFAAAFVVTVIETWKMRKVLRQIK